MDTERISGPHPSTILQSMETHPVKADELTDRNYLEGDDGWFSRVTAVHVDQIVGTTLVVTEGFTRRFIRGATVEARFR